MLGDPIFCSSILCCHKHRSRLRKQLFQNSSYRSTLKLKASPKHYMFSLLSASYSQSHENVQWCSKLPSSVARRQPKDSGAHQATGRVAPPLTPLRILNAKTRVDEIPFFCLLSLALGARKSHTPNTCILWCFCVKTQITKQKKSSSLHLLLRSVTGAKIIFFFPEKIP